MENERPILRSSQVSMARATKNAREGSTRSTIPILTFPNHNSQVTRKGLQRPCKNVQKARVDSHRRMKTLSPLRLDSCKQT